MRDVRKKEKLKRFGTLEKLPRLAGLSGAQRLPRQRREKRTRRPVELYEVRRLLRHEVIQTFLSVPALSLTYASNPKAVAGHFEAGLKVAGYSFRIVVRRGAGLKIPVAKVARLRPNDDSAGTLASSATGQLIRAARLSA